jgi:predicted aldo/keto reductase-like oxidoreductase
VQYRSLPKYPGIQIPILGFGCMRLPIIDRDMARIDEERAESLIRSASSRGVTYLDTAYPYHGGNSELFVGRLLAGGLRDRVLLATKLPTWLVQAEADFERFLDEQLQRLRTDRIDFYMFHGLSAERWEMVQRLRGLDAFDRARADGRIRHAGFSFHGSPDSFTEIIDGYDWDFCQIQYNFLDVEYQAGAAGVRHAAERRVAVFAMEPLRGGALAAHGPAAVLAIWARAAVKRSPAEWALRWLWNQPDVTMALSGMNAPGQLDENIAAAESARAGGLSDEESSLFAEVRDVFRAKMKVDCTTCGYCLPCPTGVAIPDVFSSYNTSAMFDARQPASFVYRTFVVGRGNGADQCTRCGECEPKCPQQIRIQDKLEEAHAHLTGS